MGAAEPMTRGSPISLRVLGRFSVQVDSAPVSVAPAGQRVLAVLAVLGGVADRCRVAGIVWPDRPNERALANLRGALWRLPPAVRDAIDRRGEAVGLGEQWDVDLERVVAAAARLSEPGSELPVAPSLFTVDLLPDWDLDWLVVLREKHRQLRLHALEDVAELQLAAGRPLDAVDTAMAAIEAEPLRETAQHLLLRAHLAAGNRAAVLRQYKSFRQLVMAELGIEPGLAMRRTAEVAAGR